MRSHDRGPRCHCGHRLLAGWHQRTLFHISAPTDPSLPFPPSPQLDCLEIRVPWDYLASRISHFAFRIPHSSINPSCVRRAACGVRAPAHCPGGESNPPVRLMTSSPRRYAIWACCGPAVMFPTNVTIPLQAHHPSTLRVYSSALTIHINLGYGVIISNL